MPLALNLFQKKVLCSAEKSSDIWAEPHSRSLAEQFSQTVRLVGPYLTVGVYEFCILKFIVTS